MMLTISWLMTLVALVIIAAIFRAGTVVVKALAEIFPESSRLIWGHVNGHVEEMYRRTRRDEGLQRRRKVDPAIRQA